MLHSWLDRANLTQRLVISPGRSISLVIRLYSNYYLWTEVRGSINEGQSPYHMLKTITLLTLTCTSVSFNSVTLDNTCRRMGRVG